VVVDLGRRSRFSIVNSRWRGRRAHHQKNGRTIGVWGRRRAGNPRTPLSCTGGKKFLDKYKGARGDFDVGGFGWLAKLSHYGKVGWVHGQQGKGGNFQGKKNKVGTGICGEVETGVPSTQP